MTRELPRQFVEMLEAFASRDFEQLAEALATTEPEVSVRLNRRRGGSQIPSLLSEVVDTPVTWTDGGYYLSSRPRFTLDPALHQGRYYVQDASSMFISRAVAEALRHLDLSRQLLYIDACAAPGGKTTAAINVLPDGTTLIANEFVPLRAAVLHENITKWGYPDVIVTRGDTAAIGDALTGMADIIAADVPCSGEGMMRKDPEAIVQWSPKLVNDSARLQREIITNLWPALKPGGFFIYSTCTFNRRENEENLEWILQNFDADPIAIDIAEFPEITRGHDISAPCYRFLPGKTRGEGLFLALIRRRGEHVATVETARGGKKAKSAKKPAVDTTGVAPWLDPEAMAGRIVEHDSARDAILVTTPRMKALAERISRAGSKIIGQGVDVATVKGRDLIPTQALALSSLLNRATFPTVEVSTDTAIDYLMRNVITLPSSTPRGYVLLTHDGRPLGFVKNLGNRANNLYPAPWRILHR